jgi:hypothetical protein
MEQHAPDGVLKETAIAIGGAAGTLAALAKSVMPHEKPAPAAKRKGKLPAKKKARLPRKQKKMLASRKLA